MSIAAAVCTTFGDEFWKPYAKAALESFCAYWPKEVPILVQLDGDLLAPDVQRLLRDGDGLKCGREKEHADFVRRNSGRDDPKDYRKQAVRFCHKVFALKYSLDAVMRAKAGGAEDAPRYLIWMDADVLTTRKVTIDEIAHCLPKDNAAVAYLGRKDWPHSECGWLAFDLDHGGGALIDIMVGFYAGDTLFDLEQWHDSWVFDHALKHTLRGTNLTPAATGMDVWPQSPMAAWSRHYKGPIAKSELSPSPPKNSLQPLRVQTRNSIPDESIHQNIILNQAQIKNWIRDCTINEEEVVVVSAGPMLIAEDILAEQDAGRRIVAVKHALEPLREAGVKPWACILLDPRDHMTKFTDKPDTSIIWIVASQVMPEAVTQLLDAGCTVWGYHASVGANEEKYTHKQFAAVVNGGSATATRGLYVLEKLGFRKFRLYGYDLCLPDKPNLAEKDEHGQPKYFEISLDACMPHYKAKRAFWSKGELIAQYEEFKQTLLTTTWDIKAFGHGIAPFIVEAKRASDLRAVAKKAKMQTQKTVSYEDMLWINKTRLWARLRKRLQKTRRKRMRAASF